MIKIESIEEFNQILKENEQFYFLKHSLTCPISQEAFEEYESHENSHGETKHYYLAVQEARPLSNHIAETFQVKHESPQAFLFNKETVAWHASHWKITSKSLTQATEEIQ
ncbi:bacillithiol system redox-active protein YtxJ [Robertmurraya sp. Marseille-Q9965]